MFHTVDTVSVLFKINQLRTYLPRYSKTVYIYEDAASTCSILTGDRF
jgi:hypothetical protein